jgi:uroporphyrin-III C-methyltransferase
MTDVTSSSTTSAPEPALLPAAKTAAATRVSSPLLWLVSLAALAAAGVLGFVFVQQRTVMEALAGDVSTQQQRSATVEQRLAASEAVADRLAQQLQQALDASRNSAGQADVAALRRELDLLRQEVVSRMADSQQDWLLVEATTLLRLAQQQALQGRNVASAVSLYTSAAERLQQLADPALAPALAALQLELDALRAVEVPPIQSLYLQLGDLSAQLATLVVQSEGESPLQFAAPGAAALPATATWWDALKHTLAQYFVITRRDVPVLAQLTPAQTTLIRQAIALQLETARLALLQGDGRLYQGALDAAAQGITQQLQGEAKPALLASLQRLREEPIAVVLPPLGAALQALEAAEAAPVSEIAPAPAPEPDSEAATL